jgi:hypothetical protein
LRPARSPRWPRVLKAGGVLFPEGTWNYAHIFVDDEPYPPKTTGLIPQVPGSFHPSIKVDGLAVYIPAKERR